MFEVIYNIQGDIYTDTDINNASASTNKQSGPFVKNFLTTEEISLWRKHENTKLYKLGYVIEVETLTDS
jgi:hypothetical protein